MIIDVIQEKVYIPKWNGNRDLPEDEQIRVVHRFLKAGERERYQYFEDIKYTRNKEGRMVQQEKDLVYHQDSIGQARAMIIKIENLSIKVNGKEEKISTGDALFDTIGIPSGLASEIEAYLLGATPEVEKDPL